MQIVFTLCSNNYLAHAKTLGDSIKSTNPDIKFIIGLTDQLSSEIDYTFFEQYEILTYDKIGFDFFDEMVLKYNVIEFNTSVKPFYFEYLFNQYGRDALVYYFDPDIVCFSTLQPLHDLLITNNILITPHITKPNLELTTFETTILNVGIYNLGFIGMKFTEQSILFLKWWQIRLRNHCFIDLPNGLFVDQIWINYLPILFDKVYIVPGAGYNMACWNFYERKLIRSEGVYYVNDLNTALVFFHFSGFNPSDMRYMGKIISKEFELISRVDLIEIFTDYRDRIKLNKYDLFSKITPLLNFKSISKTKIKYTFRQKVGGYVKLRFNHMVKVLFNI